MQFRLDSDPPLFFFEGPSLFSHSRLPGGPPDWDGISQGSAQVWDKMPALRPKMSHYSSSLKSHYNSTLTWVWLNI